MPALTQEGEPRENGQVAEITHLIERGIWPEGSRFIVRRERPHPGAQLSFTDHDGHRFQVLMTDQPDAVALTEPGDLQRLGDATGLFALSRRLEKRGTQASKPGYEGRPTP